MYYYLFKLLFLSFYSGGIWWLLATDDVNLLHLSLWVLLAASMFVYFTILTAGTKRPLPKASPPAAED